MSAQALVTATYRARTERRYTFLEARPRWRDASPCSGAFRARNMHLWPLVFSKRRGNVSDRAAR